MEGGAEILHSQDPSVQVSDWPFTDGEHGGLAESQVCKVPKHLPSEVEERGWGGSEVRKGRRGSGSSGVLKKVNFR